MSKNTLSYFILIAAFSISMGSQADESKTCSLRRPVVEKDGKTFYVVGDRARSLYMIARDLYGEEKYWLKLAQWNKMTAPYVVSSGQYLEIKEAPTIDEAKSNDVLIKAWGKLNSTSMVLRLSVYNNELANCQPKKDPPVVAAAVAETKPEAITEPATKVEAVTENTKTEEPSHHEEPGEAHHKWALSAALTSSVFQLSSTEEETQTDNTLYTKINYGVNLGVHYEKNEKWIFSAGAGVEHVQFESPDDSSLVIDKDQLNLLQFNLEAAYKINPYVIVSMGALYVQRPAYRPTVTGATIDTVFLPELTLGGEFRLFETPRSETWLVTELSSSFATKTTYHEVKPGYGYIAGFKFEYKFDHTTMNILPAYRYLKEDTTTAKEEQQAGLLTLGWEW